MNYESISEYKDGYGRSWKGPYPFDFNSIAKNAPRKSGVYQLLKKNYSSFEAMYIGIATGKTIYERLSSHYRGTGNRYIAGIGDTSLFYFVYWPCDDFLTIKNIESHVVTDTKPPFNIRPEYQDYIGNITVH